MTVSAYKIFRKKKKKILTRINFTLVAEPLIFWEIFKHYYNKLYYNNIKRVYWNYKLLQISYEIMALFPNRLNSVGMPNFTYIDNEYPVYFFPMIQRRRNYIDDGQ